jgi:ribosomal-protein-serine acetyltransferase
MKRFAAALAVDAHTTLVPVGRVDAAAVFALVDRNRAELSRWMPWARDATATTTAAFVTEAVAAAQTGSGFHFTLCCSDEPVGALGLHQIDARYRSAQMGYWLDRGAGGRGLVTRAARVLLDWAFDDLGLERVELRIHPHNVRSRAVAERLGCSREGRLREERLPEDLRDVDLFVMTARRWRR